ncbi:MAG: hypothetical protein GHHEDOFH_01568 [Pseudorhodoplanes sp.]|nr:hypothetical protein [Pseudorhodoplanes sp.]
MPRDFPLQDEGPGMNEMFGDLAVMDAEQRDREQNCPGHVAPNYPVDTTTSTSRVWATHGASP